MFFYLSGAGRFRAILIGLFRFSYICQLDDSSSIAIAISTGSIASLGLFT